MRNKNNEMKLLFAEQFGGIESIKILYEVSNFEGYYFSIYYLIFVAGELFYPEPSISSFFHRDIVSRV